MATFAAAFGYFQAHGGDLKHDPIVFWIMLIGGIIGLVAAAMNLFWTLHFIYLALKKRLSSLAFMMLMGLDLVKYAIFILALANNNVAYYVIWPLLTALEIVFYARRVSLVS